LVHILEKGRESVTGCEVEVEAERAAADPKVFTAIHLAFKLRGHGLKPAAVERAITLSAEKYCSASVMLGKTAKITHSSTIEDATPAA
jgi:putative redox protein